MMCKDISAWLRENELKAGNYRNGLIDCADILMQAQSQLSDKDINGKDLAALILIQQIMVDIYTKLYELDNGKSE